MARKKAKKRRVSKRPPVQKPSKELMEFGRKTRELRMEED